VSNLNTAKRRGPRRGLPPGTHGLPREQVLISQRGRLLHAVTAAVADRGYAATTITEIVDRAGVSRRTFYEHFADKEECFLAAYDAGSEALLERVMAAQAQLEEWRDSLRAGVRAYLTAFAEEPAYAKATMVDVLGAGPRALARRRQINRRYAGILEHFHSAAREQHPGLPALTQPIFTALIAAVDGLVCDYIEQGRARELPALENIVVYLELALLAGHDAAARAIPS